MEHSGRAEPFHLLQKKNKRESLHLHPKLSKRTNDLAPASLPLLPQTVLLSFCKATGKHPAAYTAPQAGGRAAFLLAAENLSNLYGVSLSKAGQVNVDT